MTSRFRRQDRTREVVARGHTACVCSREPRALRGSLGYTVYRSVRILPAMTDRPNAHDALLAATSELTYARGITGTGVEAIAARAGVTKRTLYQHFGSKDRLVAEALNDRR